MARQTITKTIDGIEYKIHQRGATESLKLFTQLVKLFGVPISKALDIDSLEDIKGLLPKENEEDGTGSKIDISGLVAGLAEKLDENKVVNLVKLILNQTMADGKQLDAIFDVHFAGRLKHLVSVIIEVLKVEYTAFPQDNPEM